jgi:ATP-dependent DNA helicase RecG
MQRLLQGDVGSGKTVVAALAMLHAVENGHQAALMAPTEILAEQHYRKLAAWLEPLGIEVAWLSGSLKKRDKAPCASRSLGAGETPIAIGTHALIEDKVDFARSARHRRRAAPLRRAPAPGAAREGQRRPHQLMMSATPIPRTLAMSYYADLDVSVLDELPPGRTPVPPSWFRKRAATRSSPRARRLPRAAPGLLGLPADRGVRNAATADREDTYARLVAELPDLKVGLVHGRLKADGEGAVMAPSCARKSMCWSRPR